jgi:ribosome modulation factor
VPLSQTPRVDRGDTAAWEATARASQRGAGAGLQGLLTTSCTPFGEIQQTTPWNGVSRTAQMARDLREQEPANMDHVTARGRPQSIYGQGWRVITSPHWSEDCPVANVMVARTGTRKSLSRMGQLKSS